MDIAKELIDSIKGFLDDDEGLKLHELALESGKRAPLLEIGSYCGKSAMYLGDAARKNDTVLYSIDHHRGSEEQQPGEEYFDVELYDEKNKCVDTLPLFRTSINRAGLEDYVIPVISCSEHVSKKWETPLGLVFVDGGHSYESCLSDYVSWSEHVIAGGYLVFHDICPDPDKGGQAPFEVYKRAVSSGLFHVLPMFKTMGILRKI